MNEIAKELAEQGWILRSGKAEGADTAFQLGAERTLKTLNIFEPSMEIYLPWDGFNDNGLFQYPEYEHVVGNSPTARKIAMDIHPAWNRCSRGAKLLHTRNVFQILGMDLNTPSRFVLYFAKEKNGRVQGGTATAVKLAKQYEIPTINMFNSDWYSKYKKVLNDYRV